MSLTQNNLSLWEDIKELYSLLNVEKVKFGYSTVSIPENKDELEQVNNIQLLKDAIESMTVHDQLKTIASTASVQVPSRGDLVSPTPFNTMETILTNIRNTAANGSFYSTTASTNGTFFSGFYGSTASRNGTFFSGFYNSTASQNGVNFSGFYGSTASQNGTFFSGFYSSTASRNSSGFYSTTSSSRGTTFWSAGFQNRSGFGTTTFSSGFFSTTAARQSARFNPSNF